MKNNKGFIELKDVNDYWHKLNYDYNNLRKNYENVYDAFNFFVTAWHLTEWYFAELFPNLPEKDIKEKIWNFKNENSIVKICEHIANGGKHFKINSDRHKLVKEIEKSRVYEEGCYEEDVYESPIIIHLDENIEGKFNKSISSLELSEQIMTFWRFKLNEKNMIK